jgi:membrane-associated phospholipid phosphatase
LANKISYVLSNLIIWALISVCSECVARPTNLLIETPGSIPYYSYSKSNLNRLSYKESESSFYKRDSIFSFRSSKGYLPSLIYNFGEQITAPIRFTSKQWLMTGAAVGITTALIHVDNEIDDWARVQKRNHAWINKSSPVITKFGGNWGVYSVIATGLIGAVSKNKKAVQTSLLATQAMITSGVWVNMIKIFTGRERPIADYSFSKSEGGKWYGPFAMYDQDLAIRKPVSAFDAFPSGHTATAFSIATVFASQYKDKPAIPIICYSAATLVAISRLTEHQHWASDVFVGGLMGYLCGKQVVNHYNKIHQYTGNSFISKMKNKTDITFIQYGNKFGFFIRW